MHAEAAALHDARLRGIDVTGAIAYVTLEPCNHTGRTGPCAVALVQAGVSRVEYAVADPNPTAAGGAAYLADHGVEAEFTPNDEAHRLNRRWLVAMRRQSPYVIAKWASTLDGRTAAADGTSFWITGEQAREHVHQVRATMDALIVGTGTVATDNPQLSARPGGIESAHQPLRIVVGERQLPHANVWRDDHAIRIASHNPRDALVAAWDRECRVVLIEGGSTITSAFLAAGLVDEVHAYIAPAIVGDGPVAVQGVGIGTMTQALRGSDVDVTTLGADTLITALLTEES